MISFLYCFDKNYNFQAFSSIISILDKVDKKINLYIIHNEYNDISFLPKIITNHKFLSEVEVFRFDKKPYKYPNLYNSHVSEATYYRLFCTEYLPKDLETIFYIDADVICVKNPIKHIEENTKLLLNSEYTISSKTEIVKNKKNEDVFSRLELKSDSYFNAGVMNINLHNWRNLSIDFYGLLDSFGERLQYWDQDLLNYIFDGSYLELDQKLNKVVDFAYYEYELNFIEIDKVISDGALIHFAGSHKPWSVNGIMCNLSEIYHVEFRKVSKNYFHIVHKIRSYSVYYFFKNIFNLKFFRISHKLIFLFEFLKSLLKIDIKKNEN